MRGATKQATVDLWDTEISIHAPRAGSDVSHAVKVKPNIRFQSTLPVRGATPCAYVRVRMVSHFNPRSPCGERPSRPVAMPLSSATFQSTLPVRGATELGLSYSAAASGISIHAPRAGSDHYQNFRHSLQTVISIHAPRAGSDFGVPGDSALTTYFNPRSPCGERHAIKIIVNHGGEFQSTLPVRGATFGVACGFDI